MKRRGGRFRIVELLNASEWTEEDVEFLYDLAAERLSMNRLRLNREIDSERYYERLATKARREQSILNTKIDQLEKVHLPRLAEIKLVIVGRKGRKGAS